MRNGYRILGCEGTWWRFLYIHPLLPVQYSGARVLRLRRRALSLITPIAGRNMPRKQARTPPTLYSLDCSETCAQEDALLAWT